MERLGVESFARWRRGGGIGLLWHAVCALCRLGVPDAIVDGSASVETLASGLGLAADPLARVLRFFGSSRRMAS